MAVFNHSEFDNHEQVVFCSDAETGLKAIIAVHSTALGPAVGGCRLWDYASDEAALNDVLRLSRGMTYKNAMAGLPLGGGKSVIIGNAKNIKSEALFRAFGRMIHRLSGSYYSAEDVNITTGDIMIVNKETPYVAGLEGKSGNPAPFTALGTYRGIKAAAKHQFGSDVLAGKKVMVQGIGHVGETLVDYLTKEGAIVTITDINEERLYEVGAKYHAKIFTGEDLYSADVDIYAPCAMGATINDATVHKIKAKVIDELHSVYPVCEDNLDNVIGLVLLKDLFVSFESGTFDLKSITRDAVYLIEQTSAYKALENFKTSKMHYAFVVDEHAIFQGVITLNDILEALVGDASDFDEDEYKLVANEDGTWLVDGQYSLHDFLTFFDLDELINDYEVTTVSGFFITELGNIPNQGDKIIWNKLDLEALVMDGAKIDKVLIKQYKE